MPFFPLLFRPKESYKECPRAFGCNRDKGARLHAGCDLYAPVGSEIIAVEDGEIIRPLYPFYLDTFALEVKHPSGIIRYGETQRRLPKNWKVGDKVRAGEVLGYVGRLTGLSISMVHLELYTGNMAGPLTQRAANKHQRRADLINPTSFLDSCELWKK